MQTWIEFVQSVVVDRSADVVWGYVRDVRNDVEWRRGVVEIEVLTPPPLQPMSQIREVVRFLGRGFVRIDEVTRLNEDTTTGFEMALRSREGPVLSTGWRRVEPFGTGRTRTTTYLAVRAGRVATRVVAPLLRPILAEDLRRMKRIVEARPSTRQQRRVPYGRTDPDGRQRTLERPLSEFLLDVPDLVPYGVVPPHHILNEVLQRGEAGEGTAHGVRWSPFVLSREEYDSLVADLKALDLGTLRDEGEVRFAAFPIREDPDLRLAPHYMSWLHAVRRKYAPS